MAKKIEQGNNMVDQFQEFKEHKNIDKTTMISVLEESFTKIPLNNAAFFRLQPKLSMHPASRFSNTAITVEKLAKDMKRKKRAPHSRPPAMPRNTLGNVTKMREGPASGVTPKEKQAGKMMSPAIRATKVSSTQMRTASLVRVLSRLM